MSEVTVDFFPPDRKLFRPASTLGEAMALVARAIAPAHTAKTLQRRWKIDPHTAEKVGQGITSATTLVKAVKAEGRNGWALWDALGELIIGESREDYDERQFAELQLKADYARQRLEDRRARRLELEAKARRLPHVDRGEHAGAAR